jgi:ribonuclease VapC
VIIDSSAVIAILREESDWLVYAQAIDEARTLRLSAGSYVECSIVLERCRNPVLSASLDDFIEESEIAIEPVTVEQARVARQAYRDFGKGSGHKAGLNFGDCFSYALAKVKREPILFKGDDFQHTDLRAAV